MDDVVRYIESSHERYIEELKSYLAIPSVSTSAEHAADMRRCAEWTADELRRVGLDEVMVADTPGFPAVLGEWRGAPGAPTLLFYGHYDVQPPDPLDEWLSPPFQGTVRDGELYARGAADDKGQIFMHFKAVEALIRKKGRLPLNVKFLLEGEEEVGSVNLDTFLREWRDHLAADVVVISDSPMFDRGVPSICYGLRGLVYYQINLRAGRHDLHSGAFGGAVVNPANLLSEVLAKMKDGAGVVTIPGFYDRVRPLSDREQEAFAALPFNATEYFAQVGAPPLAGEVGYSALERLWVRPTFEVNGLMAGFTGEGAKTVIPASAMAKVSMRLVPDQDPDEITDLFQSYLKRVVPPAVEITISRFSSARPWVTEVDHPFIQAAARAIERGFGKWPVFTRHGGSIPIVSSFHEVLGAPCVLFGVVLPDRNAHAPNEKLHLESFFRGVVSTAFLYQELGALRDVAAAQRQGARHPAE